MIVTFLGTGTSQGVPVIACNCYVCTSANYQDKRLRSSILIKTADKTIVIDTGPDFRYQMLRAKVSKLDAIVFTHEHKDHIAGLDDIRPFNYRHKKPIDVYANTRVQKALQREFYYIFNEAKYPGVPEINIHDIEIAPFNIGKTQFTPIEVLHHKLPVLGFRINDFTYITDAKTVNDTEKEKIKGSKILVINALQKNEHISHLTFNEAILFANEMGAEKTYFTHISHNLGSHAEISAELPSNIELAYDGLELTL